MATSPAISQPVQLSAALLALGLQVYKQYCTYFGAYSTQIVPTSSHVSCLAEHENIKVTTKLGPRIHEAS